jgi:hypothetical protein
MGLQCTLHLFVMTFLSVVEGHRRAGAIPLGPARRCQTKETMRLFITPLRPPYLKGDSRNEIAARGARNDTPPAPIFCLCEERSDEAISTEPNGIAISRQVEGRRNFL